MRYDGGKGRCYQHIINLMPPHRVYIELFLGGGAVMRHKRPAEVSIGVDLDETVIQSWRDQDLCKVQLHCTDALDFLSAYDFIGDELLYADPPYLPRTRRRSRVYRHDLDEGSHVRLLTALGSLSCRVILSGYPSDLYDEMLRNWARSEFNGTSHIGRRREVLWHNFEPPTLLHDYAFIGDTFRDRERVRRRAKRWQRRLELMPECERLALLTALQSKPVPAGATSACGQTDQESV